MRPATDTSCGELCGACEPTLHGVCVHYTCLLELKLAAREYGEVRDAADVIPRGEFGDSPGVDLQHDGAAREVVRHLGNMRRSHMARATPFCPEIHEDGYFAVAHYLVELRKADLHGRCHRG